MGEGRVREIYQYKESDAFDFARFIGAKTTQRSGQLHFQSCPYCRGKGKGNENTFAIDIKTGQFNCKRSSCGVTGNMYTLHKDFGFSLGKMADEYYSRDRGFRKFKKPEKPIDPTPAAIKYLEGRGISKQTIERYQITTKKDDDKTLVFPFFNESGAIELIKYRNIDRKSKEDGSKEWSEKDCRPILFGMQQCNMENKTLVITEGQIDSLSVAEAGIENAVSVHGGAKNFRWIPQCWDWLNRFDEIIVFGDMENGHMTLLDEITSRLPLKVKHVKTEDYGGCKDANDILRKYGKDQIRKCIESAEYVPIRQIKDLADVENIDIFSLEKLKTGIKELDRCLYGGLPFGSVTIVTGKAGEGKSTLSSQMLAQAVQQGHTCFAYSGELPDYLFKSWIDFQIAGPGNIIEYQNAFGESGYTIPKELRERITEWYRGKIFLYDNAAIDVEERKGLIEIIEIAISRYGARVLLIDNLMTALDLDLSEGSDQYENQSYFVKHLTRIALKYKVLIILVAHKRKNNDGGTNGMDSILGSSNISNLAGITISYERGTKKDELQDSQRKLRLLKNRIFGKTEYEGWVLEYDNKSKRIFCDKSEKEFDYDWKRPDFRNVTEEEEEEIPF